MRLHYVAPGDDPLLCSQCGERADVLARLPLTGYFRGPAVDQVRGPPVAEETGAWLGLCQDCVRRLLDGFASARAKADYTEEDPPTCPTCGRPIDSSSGITTDTRPEADDLTVCTTCGELLRYQVDLSLRKCEPAELGDMTTPERASLCQISKRIRTRWLISQNT